MRVSSQRFLWLSGLETNRVARTLNISIAVKLQRRAIAQDDPALAFQCFDECFSVLECRDAAAGAEIHQAELFCWRLGDTCLNRADNVADVECFSDHGSA